MSPFQKIAKNALANGAGLLCEAIISFCMLPYILHRIGDAAYGVWAFTIAVSGYMGILNLGFRPAINKYVAQYNATGDWQKIRDMLQASLCCYSVCALIIVATCSLIAVFIDSLFNIPVEFSQTASVLVFLVGIQMSTGLIAVIFGGVISGLQRYEINNGIEIGVMLTRTLLILLFLNRYPNLLTLAAAHFSTTLLGYLTTFLIARKIAYISPLRIFRKPSRETFKTIFKFSVITFIISTIGRVIMFIDSPLIAAILTTSAVTYYTIGNRLIKYLNNLTEVLMNVLAPATSDLQARGKAADIQNIFLFSSKATSLIVFPIIAFLITFGREFLQLWLKGEYTESYQVMVIIGLARLVYLPQLSSVPILYGMAKHKVIMYLSIVSGILSVILAILLGQRMGLIGIAFGLGVPQAILSGVICPIYVSKLLKFPYFKWLTEVYIRAGGATLPFLCSLFLLKEMVAITSWRALIAVFLFSGILHSLSIWLLATTAEEKKILRQVWGRLRMRLGLSLYS